MKENWKAPAGRKQGIVERYARLGRLSKFTEYEKIMGCELKRLNIRHPSIAGLPIGVLMFPKSLPADNYRPDSGFWHFA